ncbi:hypothetical protein WA538_005591, partial [Blastocystis sp. DL]
MQKNPVDDVLSKIIGEILKRNGFESVSKIAFNTITDLTKEYIGKIGRNACEEAQMIMRPNVSLHEILSSVDSIVSVSQLLQYSREKPYSDFDTYTFPNSSFQRITPIPSSTVDTSLPFFLPPQPDPHIASNTQILAVLRESDKSESRKRLLEERQRVKKSICHVNESEPTLWELQEQMERKKQRVDEEEAQPLPLSMTKSKNPSMLPAIPRYKPVATESLKGITSTEPE